MASTNDGGPVLPEVQKVRKPNSNKTHLQRIPGMRLRDYFAAQALQALVIGRTWGHLKGGADDMFATWANSSYGVADAMLAARNRSSVHAQLVIALKDCVSVMERELNGLAVIQPELKQARAALAATEA